jgi:hypothetical protein
VTELAEELRTRVVGTAEAAEGFLRFAEKR